MQELITMQSLWIAVGSIGLALLVQLVFLGVCLGRSDRQTLEILKKARGDWSQTLQALHARISTLEESHASALAELQRELARVRLREASPESRAKPGGFNLDKKHHVVSLAQKGLDSEDISRRLRIYQGETELVLGLKQYLNSLGSGEQRQAI